MSLLYSKKAAKDVLKARRVFKLKRVKKSLLVVWQNQQGKTCSGFVARSLFVKRFNDVRDKAATTLEVRQYTSAPNWYQVYGETSSYRVILGANTASCQCKDFHHQWEAFGKGYCKHLRAVGLHIVGKSVSLQELTSKQTMI